MGLFVRDDDYDETVRMTGFNRYKQLLSFYAGHWFKLGFIAFVSAIPLMAAITYSILTSSLIVLLISTPLTGMVLGPFFAGLVDAIMRGLRDDTGLRWNNYKKSLRQNFPASLFHGAILGLIVGIYSFIVYLVTSGFLPGISSGFYVVGIVAMIILLIFENLLWPQFVLFNQPLKQTLQNTILFSSKYLWKTLLVVFFELLYIGFLTIFAPLSIILLPFLGIWYPVFLVLFSFYDKLNMELEIETKFNQAP